MRAAASLPASVLGCASTSSSPPSNILEPPLGSRRIAQRKKNQNLFLDIVDFQEIADFVIVESAQGGISKTDGGCRQIETLQEGAGVIRQKTISTKQILRQSTRHNRSDHQDTGAGALGFMLAHAGEKVLFARLRAKYMQ